MNLANLLKNQPIFYVTRDIERATSLNIPGYFIISNSTPSGKQIAKDRTNILLIENDGLLDTHELLNHKDVQEFIEKNSGASMPSIVVFKNTTVIEKICAEHDWKLLNPSAKLAQKIEEKITQVEWLGELTKYLPPHKIQLAKDVQFDQTKDWPFILQFNRTHTGLGTMFISHNSELAEIQNKFPDRPVRITEFIPGPMLTSNNVVTDDRILIGNMSYQITGMQPFTDKPFATIGNDWALPHKILKDKHFAKYTTMVTDIGNKLRADGWKGLFGIDAVYDTQKDDIYLIEINARQPASTTYESQLQQKQSSSSGLTTFEAHLLSLLEQKFKNNLIAIHNGAQIVQRVMDLSKQNLESVLPKLAAMNLKYLTYTNTDSGSDLLRIQSEQAFMKGHLEFNTLGRDIQQTMPFGKKLLSNEALMVLSDYDSLPFPQGVNRVSCPYFNNRRSKVRAGLRVLLGKGSPQEIVDEANLFALREKVDLMKLDEEKLKQFLVDHNLGIDCSAFAYSILAAEYAARGKGLLSSKLFYPNSRSLLRKLIIKLRAIENINVEVLSHEKNSHVVPMADILLGDFISILRSGKEHNLNHILLVYKIEVENNEPKFIDYCHSFQWSQDGKYNHGIKFGTIEITDVQKSLLEQKWVEAEKEGEQNETFLRAREAEVLELKRLSV